MVNSQCPFCNQNTAGQHELNCPNHPAYKDFEVGTIEKHESDCSNNFNFPQYPLYCLELNPPDNKVHIFHMGWKCPRCRRVWNPDVKSCDCEEI